MLGEVAEPPFVLAELGAAGGGAGVLQAERVTQFMKRGEVKGLDILAEGAQLMDSRTASLTRPMAAVRI